MMTFVALVLYITGVYTVYFQMQRWSDDLITKEDYDSLFRISLLSWLVFPLYILVIIIKKEEEL